MVLISLGSFWLSNTSPGLNQCCSTQGWERMSPLNRIIPVFADLVQPGLGAHGSHSRVEPVLVNLVHQ